MTYPPPHDPNQPASGPPSYGQPPEPPQYGTPPPGHPAGPPQFGAYPAPMQQPPKKRKKWPFIVGGIVLVMILGCVGIFALFVGGAAKVAEDLDDNQSGKNAAAGEMNKPATDGKFQFTVTGMKCGVAEVGGEFANEKAQGEFCLIDVTIKNVGTSAEIFNDGSQKAYDGANTEYSVDSGAAIFANEDSSTFLEQINPGNSVKGKLVFDVPSGTKLTSVVLHESAFTAGVKVPLV
ncbi:Mpr protein [Actinoplanes italicus]|nr:Mpr protein [Actinoplanes italicus]